MDEKEVPRLRVSEAAGVYRTITLETSPFTIGRSGSCDLKINDACISRHHAQIILEGDAYRLVDTHSKLGTRINGSEVDSQVLQHGDRIQFGPSSLPEIVFLTREDSAVLPAIRTDTASIISSAAGGDLQNVSRLLQSARLLSGGLPLGEVLDVVLDIAIDVTKAERGFITLKDPSGDVRFRRGRNVNKLNLSEDNFHISKSVLKRVIDTGSKVLLMDTGMVSDFAVAESIADLDLRTIMCIPLTRFEVSDGSVVGLNQGEVIGALYLDSRSVTTNFSSIGEAILDKLAADATTVIENARLLREFREKERLEDELAMAQEIQNLLLPKINGSYEYFETHAYNVASRHIGGDYYDMIQLPGGDYAFVIADVAGKGISAAILCSMVQGILFAEATQQSSMPRCIENVNRYLVQRTNGNRFVTMFFGILESRGVLRFINAGHNAPLLVHPDGRTEELTASGMVLGLFDTAEYQEKATTLTPGDLVCLFTDGITEAANDQREFFGEDRLTELVRKYQDQPLDSISARIQDAVAEHAGDTTEQDDLTLLFIRYLGGQ